MITTFSSRAVVLLSHNIDTDQIIPARFLTTTDKTGLGDHLFADWRYHPSGDPRDDFVLNDPASHGAQVLVAGHNFGCGSSREHAPWALLAFGFRAVVSTRFADIFRNNALKNGLLPVAISAPAHERLVKLLEQQADAELAIDLATQTVTLPDETREYFPVDPFAKHCLLQGVDELGFLLQAEPAIAQYEATHIPRVQTTAAATSVA